jgi:hypothetical protein
MSNPYDHLGGEEKAQTRNIIKNLISTKSLTNTATPMDMAANQSQDQTIKLKKPQNAT